MKTKEEIINLLLKQFNTVYCYNCQYNNSDCSLCEECHRKYMNWSISEEIAEGIADLILED